jgi:membrane-bound lytic murein transglycosylase F
MTPGLHKKIFSRKKITVVLVSVLLIIAFINSFTGVYKNVRVRNNSPVIDSSGTDTNFIYILKNPDYLFDLLTYNEYAESDKAFDNKDITPKRIIIKRPFFRKPEIDNLIDNYGELIIEECNQYKIDWRLILAIIHQESNFDSTARSHAGAFGLMQIMPRTGAGLQSQLQLEETGTAKNNLIAGIYYYANLVASFDAFGKDKYQFALASYNAGLSRVVDLLTIANFYNKDYKIWDTVKQYLPYLSSAYDSVHKKIWVNSQKPSGGILNNWTEPYNYVEYVMYYYEQYKKFLPGNLPEETKKKNRRK